VGSFLPSMWLAPQRKQTLECTRHINRRLELFTHARTHTHAHTHTHSHTHAHTHVETADGARVAAAEAAAKAEVAKAAAEVAAAEAEKFSEAESLPPDAKVGATGCPSTLHTSLHVYLDVAGTSALLKPRPQG